MDLDKLKDTSPENAPRVTKFLDRMLLTPAEKIARQEGAMGRRCCTDPQNAPVSKLAPGVVWEGVFTGWSGYAKANRELLFRTANSVYVELLHALKPGWDHPPTELRLSAHERTKVAPSAPFLRFFGPDAKVLPEKRHRIIYTMMETEQVHFDMVDQINNRYHELWVPSQWNAGTFRRSGVRLPIKVAPLGVDTSIYRRIKGATLPECTLISRGAKGVREIPKGFIFISVGLPSFRKGFDLLSTAFEKAFAGDEEAALVCATTHGTANVPSLAACKDMKSRIYALEGEYDEHQLARIYSASNAYATASRGEGWNLPICEAAACGLPVICPRNTTHEEVMGKQAWFFDVEKYEALPNASSVSPWYDGMPMSVFGKKSLSQLVEILRHVRLYSREVAIHAARGQKRMQTEFTWDRAAALLSNRLLEMQS